MIDLTSGPKQFCGGTPRLAEPMLLMLDRAAHISGAGTAGLGVVRGEKDVDVSEWFFKAHFFQDPVQPGSLGIEALIQLLQFYILDTDMAADLKAPRFEPLMLDAPLKWKYRGQVTPKNNMITSVMEVTEVGHDARGPFVIGTGSLWCDGIRIYEVDNMAMRVVSDPPDSGLQDSALGEAVDWERPDTEGPGPERPDPERPGPKRADSVASTPAHPESMASEISLNAAKDAMHAYWQPLRQTPDSWLGHDLLDGLMDRYVNQIHIAGADTLANLHVRPAIYLANHQVQIESLIISNLLPALTGVAMTTVANAKHEGRWIGEMIRALDAYPGCRPVEQLAYFDPADPASMYALIDRVRTTMQTSTHSFFVHTDGTRAQSCRQPTTKCSSVFLDLALELDVPIVPIRFIGGLPVDPIEGKAEFPVGHGSQDYWIGGPIEPDQLRSLPLRDRVDYVIDAINTLGGTNRNEMPLPSDAAFADRVDAWQDRTGCDEVFATAWQILADAAAPSEETLTLRGAAAAGTYRSDGTAQGDWLGDIANLVFGPKGPTQSTETATTVVVNRSTHPQLGDHVVNGVPVVPAVYVLEWFARSAAAHEPDLVLRNLTDLRVLKGLLADSYDLGGDLELNISAETVTTTATGAQIKLVLSKGVSGRPHYSCVAEMAKETHIEDRPTVALKGTADPEPSDSIYDGVLFHGPSFQVIYGVSAMSAAGFTASLGGVVDRGWPAESWYSDPAMLDGGLQMALLWTEHLLGGPSLPTSLGKLTVHRSPAGGAALRFVATLSGTTVTANKVVCDVVFHDDQGHLAAELVGVETHLLPTTNP